MAAPQLRPVDPIHEDVFAERYYSLLKWAGQLAGGNGALAQDLVHDAYVQFVLARPDLRKIQSVDRYLYGMLRNLHISHVRRATRAQASSLLAVEYDSAELSLKNGGRQDESRVLEELWQACEYACARKETSRAGSVMILRFFHGYYPGEISAITSSSKAAVSESLRAAREETVQYLRDPRSLSCIAGVRVASLPRGSFQSDTDGILLALRNAIFSTRNGACVPYDLLRRMYESGLEPVHKTILAHIVSCRTCLETVNQVLRLPPLSTRDPMDMTGRDDHRPDGPGGSRSGDLERAMKQVRRRVQQVFEHRPRQIFVSVNGYYLASLSVTATNSEAELQIESRQPIGFVEISSEQGIRLALLAAEGGMANEAGRITQTIELSDGRYLEVALSLGNPSPSLRILYHDPAAEFESCPASPLPGAPRRRTWAPRRSWLGGLGSILQSFATNKQRRIGVVLASTVLVLLVALTGRHHEALPDAMTLLRTADRMEQTAAAELALHRTIALREESASGEVISRNTVEIWQSGKLHRASRRVYDKEHHLIAGEWSNPDGTRTVMDRESAKVHIDDSRNVSPDFDTAWRFDPSAAQFARLVAASPVKLQIGPDAYLFSVQRSDAASNADGIVTADLRVTRSTLRTTAAVLVIRQGGRIRTFDYEEVGMERKDLKSVDPSTFLPKQEPTSAPHRSSGNGTKRAQLPVTPALEIAVLYHLALVDADFRENLTLHALPDGRIQVAGQVENRERKEEILRALRPLETTSSVMVKLHTVEDAIAADAPVRTPPAAIRVEKLQATSSRVPLDAEIRRNFREQGTPEAQLDQAVERFSSEIVKASLSGLQQARALEAITARFDSQQLSKASETTKMQWLAIVLHHVEPLYDRNLFLERQLRSVSLVPISATFAVAADIKDINDLRTAAKRLLDVSILNDRALSSSFSIPLHPTDYAPVQSEHLQGLLSEAMSLSSGILTASKQIETRLTETRARNLMDAWPSHSPNSYEESPK